MKDRNERLHQTYLRTNLKQQEYECIILIACLINYSSNELKTIIKKVPINIDFDKRI